MDNLFYKVIGPFNNLTERLTLPGAMAVVVLGIVMVLLMMSTPKGRFWLLFATITMFVLTQTSRRGGGTNLPAFITISAYSFRWLTAIPLCLLGTFFLFNGKGLKFRSFLVLCPLFIYLLACCIFSSGLPRYILWSFMWVGIISATMEVVMYHGFNKIMKYWLWISYVLSGMSMLVTLVTPGKAFIGLRYNGMMTNPNAYGFLVLIVLPPMLWAIFEKKQKNPLNYCFLGYLVVTVLMSGSRGSIIALLPLVVCTVFLYIKKPGLMLMLGTVSVILVFVAATVVNPEVLSRLASTQSSGRIEMWQFLWPHITSSPFGNGIGWVEANMLHAPHNSYLYMATEAGFLWAVVFFVAVLFLCFHGGFRRKYYETSENYHLKIMLLMLIFGCLLTAVFESWLIGIGGFHLPYFLFIVGLKEGLVIYQQANYGNPLEAQFDNLQLEGEEEFTPVFVAKRDYYMRAMDYFQR